MKFSMIFEAETHDTSRKAEFQLLHDCVEQAVLAEQREPASTIRTTRTAR